jgi:hypothetical protein
VEANLKAQEGMGLPEGTDRAEPLGGGGWARMQVEALGSYHQ